MKVYLLPVKFFFYGYNLLFNSLTRYGAFFISNTEIVNIRHFFRYFVELFFKPKLDR